MTVRSSETVNSESLTVSRNTYVPTPGKKARAGADGEKSKVTPAGPETCVHVRVRSTPAGLPSSVTVGFRITELAVSEMRWSGPASTWGGAFGVIAVIIAVWGKLLTLPSFTINWAT